MKTVMSLTEQKSFKKSVNFGKSTRPTSQVSPRTFVILIEYTTKPFTYMHTTQGKQVTGKRILSKTGCN